MVVEIAILVMSGALLGARWWVAITDMPRRARDGAPEILSQTGHRLVPPPLSSHARSRAKWEEGPRVLHRAAAAPKDKATTVANGASRRDSRRGCTTGPYRVLTAQTLARPTRLR